MITVKTRSAKEAFKGHIDNVEELEARAIKATARKQTTARLR